MTDTWNLSWTSADGIEVNVDNPGEYTIVSVERSLPGQFEQTQNTTESGSWLEPPQLEQDGDRSVVTIIATHGRFEIEIEGLNVEVLNDDSVPPPPMMPLTSMPPYRFPESPPSALSSRSTLLNPLPSPSSPPPPLASESGQPGMCHTCGHLGQPEDRFCAQCGTPLSSTRQS